jgi:competence protein ComEC
LKQVTAHRARGKPLSLSAVALSFSAGVLLLPILPDLPPPGLILALLIFALIVPRRVPPLRPMALLILGFAWAWFYAHGQLQQDLDPRLEGRTLSLVGWVADLPEIHAEGSSFLFDVASAQDGAITTNFTGRVRLGWYHKAQTLRAGEQWQLQVRLKARHGLANPGGFDAESWLFRIGVAATGAVRDAPDNRRITPAGFGIAPLRQALRDRLLALLPKGDPGSGIVIALLLGDRGGISATQWDALIRTGTNHLVAISGLHVGIVGGLGFALTRWLWQRSVTLCLWLAAPRAAAFTGLLLAWGYSALAGFAVSTQRSLVMMVIVLGATLLRITVRPGSGLLIAFWLVLIANPTACLSPGFWLSFGAVTALFYGMAGRLATIGVIRSWIRAQWWVSLGLLPILLPIFGRVSLISPIANSIAIPLFSGLLPLTLIAAMIALITAWSFPLYAVVWLLDQSLAGLEYVAAYPWASYNFAAVPLWIELSTFIGTILLLVPRGLPGRWHGAVLLLPLLLWQVPRPAPNAFRFILFDVGQGLATLIQTHNHNLIYDTGPLLFGKDRDSGDSVLAPALNYLGIEHIDRLIVSHADQDHAGGVKGLLAHIPATVLLTGEPERLAVSNAQQCQAGQSWNWDGVHFSMLHPQPPWSDNSNDRSCVLRIETAGNALLLTGDLGQSKERALVAQWGASLASQVLVAGHHGSAGSSSIELLEAAHPQWVLFSMGYRNRFSFPRAQVVERVIRAGAKLADTVTGGALEFLFDADGALRGPISYRMQQRHYWTHRPQRPYTAL